MDSSAVKIPWQTGADYCLESTSWIEDRCMAAISDLRQRQEQW